MEGPPSPAVLGDSLAAPGGPDGVARVTGQGSADSQRIFAWSAMCRNQKVQLKPVPATSTAIGERWRSGLGWRSAELLVHLVVCLIFLCPLVSGHSVFLVHLLGSHSEEVRS